LPQRLRDFKIPKEGLNELVEKTMADGSILGCVRLVLLCCHPNIKD